MQIERTAGCSAGMSSRHKWVPGQTGLRVHRCVHMQRVHSVQLFMDLLPNHTMQQLVEDGRKLSSQTKDKRMNTKNAQADADVKQCIESLCQRDRSLSVDANVNRAVMNLVGDLQSTLCGEHGHTGPLGGGSTKASMLCSKVCVAVCIACLNLLCIGRVHAVNRLDDIVVESSVMPGCSAWHSFHASC